MNVRISWVTSFVVFTSNDVTLSSWFNYWASATRSSCEKYNLQASKENYLRQRFGLLIWQSIDIDDQLSAMPYLMFWCSFFVTYFNWNSIFVGEQSSIMGRSCGVFWDTKILHQWSAGYKAILSKVTLSDFSYKITLKKHTFFSAVDVARTPFVMKLQLLL